MKTNKALLIKGFKHLAFTVFLMFTAPVLFWQAFRNQEHFMYVPVLIIAAILAIAAIGMAFYSIKIIMEGIFGHEE